MTLWNETIPPELRGRMAGIEQLSYMTGPLLGNVRAGSWRSGSVCRPRSAGAD